MNTLSKVALDIADFLKAEQLDIPIKISKERQLALDLIEQKSKTNFQNIFTISSQKFISRIKILINYPYMIYQGNSGLCNTATFVYILMKDYPVKFVEFAFELLATGKGKIGNFKINTSNDFRKIDFDKVILADLSLNRFRTNEVDYLFLGAIRDSKNLFLDIEFNEDELNYDSIDLDNLAYSIYDFKLVKFLLEGFPGIDNVSSADAGTPQDLIEMFDATNLYKPIVAKSAKKYLPEFELEDACKANETVILSILTGGKPNALFDLSKGSGGHSCTMFSKKLRYSEDDKNIEFEVVTWGMIALVSCTKEEFKKAFKGHLELNRK